MKQLKTMLILTTLLLAFVFANAGITANALGQSSSSSEGDSGVKPIISTSNPDLNITSVSSFTKVDYFHIVGEVLNKAQEERAFVKVSATIYDSQNKVIGTGLAYTEPTAIPPGESAPFEFLIGNNDVTDLASISIYKLMVSSR
jgi:hypothetical protein